MLRLTICIALVFVSFFSVAQAPATPELLAISVDLQTQTIVLSWNYNSPLAVDSFYIYRTIYNCPPRQDGTDHIIERLGSNTMTYNDLIFCGGGSPAIRPERYKMLAIHNGLMSYPTEYHQSMMLQNSTFDECANATTLKWTAYKGWQNKLDHYEIYFRHDLTTQPQLLQSVAAADTVFVHQNPDPNVDYYYFVKAIHSEAGRTANSNQIKVFTLVYPKPGVALATSVNVAQNQLNITFVVDTSAVFQRYLIQRSNSQNTGFQTIDSVVPPIISNTISYTDNVQSLDSVYFYKLTAINYCGEEYKTSNTVHNIVLKAVISNSGVASNHLEWNLYSDWYAGVNKYLIYRTISSSAPSLLDSTDSQTNSYDDDVSQFTGNQGGTEGKFCYFMEAILNRDTFPENFVCRSNTACAEQQPLVFLPNAFNPKSEIEKNRRFLPEVSFVSNYKLIIYNRWGLKIFETTNPSEGWDGKMASGAYARQGAYIFYISFKTASNQTLEKRGIVNVVY